MEHQKKKLLLEKVRNLSVEWSKTGNKRPKEKFFGMMTKKQMSISILVIIALLAITDIAIFYLLYLTNKGL